MMTDGLYLDDATHPVGDGGGCQGKAKEGVGRYLGFDNRCNCGRTRSLGDKFHILAMTVREIMQKKRHFMKMLLCLVLSDIIIRAGP